MPVRKRFGQNFLTDRNIQSKLISFINPEPDNVIVEIGPGKGALTEALVGKTGRLEVIEIDRDLAKHLSERFGDKITIHTGDALKFDFSVYKTSAPIKVVGNLPYNISTPLLFSLFNYSPLISDMYFLLQLEVVNRICASPADKEYGRLSVMAQFYCQPTKLMTVPPQAFTPVPKVNSAFVRLTPLSRGMSSDKSRLLQKLATTAFSSRRKTLRNALGQWLNPEEISSLGINPGDRPENMSLEDFIRCTEFLYQRDLIPAKEEKDAR